MTIDPTLAAFLGAGLTAAFNLYRSHLDRRAEERKALREMAIRVAVENYRAVAAKAEIMKFPRHEYGLGPMDGYILRMLALVNLVIDGKTKPEQLRARLSELERVGRVLEEHLTEQPKAKAPAP